MPPEKYVQKYGGTIMSDVENFNKNVKRIIETESATTTTYGVSRLRPVAELPTTIGNSGKMQGAKTVRTPAINEISKNAITLS